MNAPRRVTTTDVAREAGVSRATVSYALNGDPDRVLTEATRQRVLDAAARIGYQPSAAARLLRGGRRRNILMLSPDAEGFDPALGRLIEAIARELGARGYSLLWQLGVQGAPRPVGELTPAAVLTAPTADDPAFASLAAGFDVPVLSALPGRDDYLGAPTTAQVEHLATSGRPLVYCAPEAPGLQAMSELRWRSALRACEQRGLAAPDRAVLPDDAGAATAVLHDLLARHGGRIAVCAYNDEVALGVLAAARRLGARVPEDIAVVGADDSRLAALAFPAVSSAVVPLGDFASRFSDMVVAVATGAAADEVRLPRHAVVVVRDSAP